MTREQILKQAFKEGERQQKRLLRSERQRTPFTPLLLPPDFGEEDDRFDIYKPQSFDEYIGQEHAKDVTQIMVGAANKEGRPIPNIIIAGSAGLGKTTLAKLILEGKLHKFTDGNTANTLAESLAGYVIIDEIHNLKPEVCDSLNTVLDTNKVRIIGCTTNPGALPGPFRSRFRTVQLVPYSNDDLTAIQQNVIIRKETITAPYNLLQEISKRGRFTPRRTLQYLEFVMDLMSMRDETTLTPLTLHDAFDKIGVDENGLVDIDHRYLAALPDGRPVGLQYLEAVLQTDRTTIEEEIEPYLLQTKLIDRNSRGRFKVASLEDQLTNSLDEIFKEKSSESRSKESG